MKFLVRQTGAATLLLFSTATAFTPTPVSCPRSLSRIIATASTTSVSSSSSSSSSSTEEETEAEALLRKARELRSSAEQEEARVHGDLTQKRATRDQQTDALIDELFPPGDGTTTQKQKDLVDRLRAKKLGMATLERILLRIDERQVMAQGFEHVESSQEGTFRRVADKEDPAELERLNGLTDQLIAGVAVLDEEFRQQKQEKGQAHVAHAEREHWGGGKCAEELRARLNEVQRERSEQYQKRMEELREAQRRKDGSKFDGYNDMGTLN